jgi:uncharacterized protein (TIGR02145 family)
MKKRKRYSIDIPLLVALCCITFTVKKSTSTISNSSSIPEIKIGNQIWMAQNLNVATFRNGDTIPQVKSMEEWNKACGKEQPAWCYYNNDSKNGEVYGKLYNWYAVADKRGLAPEGWHIPAGYEWHQLYDFLGGRRGKVAKKLKSTSGWEEEGNGDNLNGFNGLAAGVRTTTAIISPNQGFRWQNRLAIWWSTNKPKRWVDVECFVLRVKDRAYLEWHHSHDGFAVRCVKN